MPIQGVSIGGEAARMSGQFFSHNCTQQHRIADSVNSQKVPDDSQNQQTSAKICRKQQNQQTTAQHVIAQEAATVVGKPQTSMQEPRGGGGGGGGKGGPGAPFGWACFRRAHSPETLRRQAQTGSLWLCSCTKQGSLLCKAHKPPSNLLC